MQDNKTSDENYNQSIQNEEEAFSRRSYKVMSKGISSDSYKLL